MFMKLDEIKDDNTNSRLIWQRRDGKLQLRRIQLPIPELYGQEHPMFPIVKNRNPDDKQ